MKLTLGQIADWIHAEGDFASSAEVYGYSIDSRTIGADEVFFAVKGERLDGHDYVEAALQAGAAAAVVSTRWVVPAEVDAAKLLRVPESEDCVLRAMQTLARQVRRKWGKRVIGITGSAGKTTTKEMVAQVLSARFNVLKSAGNLNNNFGVPLQLLRLEEEHEAAVIEMGMNHAGEIAELAKIAEPNWGVVSNVAPVHLEHFPEGIRGIAAAKRELIEALSADGVAFLNADDEFVRTFADGKRARKFGMAEGADVRAINVQNGGPDGMRFTVLTHAGDAQAHIALMGTHNVYNALAGIAVGLESGIPLNECIQAAAQLKPTEKRGEMVEWKGARIINDVYNSNPRALDAMVDALMAVEAPRHIVIAGEMLELGPDAEKLHRACGQYAAGRGADAVVGVRGHAARLVEGAADAGAEAAFVHSPEEAAEWMRANLREGDVVLLKASRGVRLERALAALLAG
ncbi:MAG: UDP-N-acetylmuramoyl-tripeptide--D-alanyl-D-alanine ligase [Acidobacteria bacterium]|nr:UDP-N-acetylmuramoyl-tripeptide--D-alanyl-D-alanine ligase [Acidobacteriota bacterium]